MGKAVGQWSVGHCYWARPDLSLEASISYLLWFRPQRKGLIDNPQSVASSR